MPAAKVSVASPVSPEESLRWLRADENFEVSLVASEPQVVDPVAIQFDDQGRIWVAEYGDYPNGPAEGETPKGRIRVLTDKDLDGFYESSRVFAEQLLFVNGLQLYRDGLIVTANGQVLFLEDRDRDGRADRREVWFQGLFDQNPQLRANDPTLGIDQRLYIANGLRSQNVESPESAPFGKTTLDLRSRDLQVDLRTGQLRAVTGPAQFGMSWDRYGHRYFCSNRNPCDAVLIEQHEIETSPLAGLSPLAAPVVPAGEASRVHPLTEAWTTSNLHAGQFSAACGVLVASSSDLPADDLGHAYTCEPTGSLVHRRALRRSDGVAAVSDPEPTHEWLASHDAWFRPVNLQEGPDGAIYVVDMYRAVIEHPQFMPQELKERPDLRYGEDRGRIYRVRPKGAASSTTTAFQQLRKQPIGQQTAEEWVALLTHPQEWFRAAASRYLAAIENPQPAWVEAVSALSQRGERIESRYRAAYLLAHWQAIEETLLAAWLADPNPAMRILGWRLLSAEPVLRDRLASGWLASWQASMRAADIEEITQAAWAMAAWQKSALPGSAGDHSMVEEVSLEVLERHVDQPRLWMALAAANRANLASFSHRMIARLMKAPEAVWGTALDDDQAVAMLSSALERLTQQTASPDTDSWVELCQILPTWMAEAPKRLAKQPRRLAMIAAVIQGWSKSADRERLHEVSSLWSNLRDLASNAGLDPGTRKLIVATLAADDSTATRDVLRQLAEAIEVEPEVFAAAVRSWSKHADPSLGAWLVARFPQASLKRRDDLFQAMLSNTQRTASLVEAIEAGQLKIQSLSPSQLQSLKGVRAAELKSRIAELVANSIDANRAQVLAAYQPCLELKPDLGRGRQVFAQQCASCHKLDTTGVNIGPDISDSRKYTPEQILTSILDPNRAIDNNYFRFAALTADGQVVEGVLVEETATTLTLRGQNDKTHVLQRSEIENFKSTGVSLMPEGLEAQIPPQAMADLIHFIKSWRYADGKIPLSVR
jgi:putative membrane-bound dehydrogenase-like protein